MESLRENYRLSLSLVFETLIRRKWLFIGTILLAIAGAGLILSQQKPVYTSVVTVQIKYQQKLLPGYYEESQAIIQRVMSHHKNNLYSLNVIQTVPNIIQFTVTGSTAEGTQNYMNNVVDDFLKQQNEPGRRLLSLYSQRLKKADEEREKVLQMLNSNQGKINRNGNLADTLAVLANAKLESYLIDINRNMMDIKQNLLLIPLCNSSVIAGPTIEKTALGSNALKVLILAGLLGAFIGITLVFIVDFIKLNQQKSK